MGSSNDETADSYGRRMECFRDYQASPFTFDYCVKDMGLQTSRGLIHQAGLRTGSLPNPSIALDEPDFSASACDIRTYCHSPGREVSMTSPSISALRSIQDPAPLPDTGSDPASDLCHYLTEVHLGLSCNLQREWLPLSPTNDQRDEGLTFPPRCDRLRRLLLRELDCEQISVCEQALALHRDIVDHGWATSRDDFRSDNAFVSVLSLLPLLAPPDTNNSHRKLTLTYNTSRHLCAQCRAVNPITLWTMPPG